MVLIAGILAGRISSVAKYDYDRWVNRSTILSNIFLGSRVDLIMPPAMRLLVNVGQNVEVNDTPIAKWNY